jgi:alkylation response protein AidB-like acyl-CoA dehydrogenase
MNILDSCQTGWKEKKYVRDFYSILKEQIIPNYSYLESKIEDNKAIFPKDWDRLIATLKDSRIFEQFIPKEYGGQKISELDIYLLMELLGYASPGLGIIFVSHSRAIDIVCRGNAAQRERYLPQMAQGHLGAIAMTEEKAGSDASAIGLMATRTDHHYLLNGQKIFISNSGLAEIYSVLVNTRGTKGPRSLSLFIVEDPSPGFLIEGLPEKDGLKVLPTGRLIFNDTPVPVENMVGEEGGGLFLTLGVIDQGRIHIAGICCGLAYRIFKEIYQYALQRKQFDHPLTSSQDISFTIASMYTQMNAARGLCLQALQHTNRIIGDVLLSPSSLPLRWLWRWPFKPKF